VSPFFYAPAWPDILRCSKNILPLHYRASFVCFVHASDGNPLQFKTISLPIQSLITASLPCLYAMRAMNTFLNSMNNVDSIDAQRAALLYIQATIIGWLGSSIYYA
jgi:hypothetical protein